MSSDHDIKEVQDGVWEVDCKTRPDPSKQYLNV